MTTKTRNIINWVLTGLVGFIFIGSAISKLTANAEALKMAEGFGLDANNYMLLGIVEITAIILFLIPRTAIIGTLLLAAYMGGAIATHLEHAQPLAAPIAIATFVWIVAFVRIPELSQRVLGKKQA
ncbi:DoxX family protein [Flavobacterium sp. ZT3R18]|uniref:DoxX family protein n=1 Tax=Flavobacterium sp. ZT3R18 TaxID=2594429 RepID=UPI00117B2473|nr:DoxX family protein [Flavobacterium sp. ZT3R18]TRX35016.1 DoxX family protein [Flavobacterium sp. ZT3R18]